MNGDGDELDLERDLDAIELVPSSGRGAHLKSGGSVGAGAGTGGGGGGDQMDEGDDEDD